MNRLFVGLLAVALMLPAQKIETETDSQDRVVKVQTAMSHITLIQAPGDITRTAVGSKAFQVERQGNLVLIQPLQEGAATNLFVWVGDHRFNYELLPPVSDAGQMDFAIDYRRAIPATPATSSLAPPPVPPNPLSNVPAEMLMKGTPVTLKGKLDAHAGVGVVIHDLYRTSDTVYIRYTLVNRLDKAVRVGDPSVVALNDARFGSSSLLTLVHTQLGSNLASKIKSDSRGVPVSLAQRNIGLTELAPRREQIGLLSIKLPAATVQPGKEADSTVLRISFPVDQAQPAHTTLVL
jgi:hypothetical protein